jgi:hypothetical protein
VAISLVGVPQTNTSASTNSVALNVPAGVAAGDVLIAWLCRAASANDVAATGWTKDKFQFAGESGGVTLLYRVAGASEPLSYTFAWAAAGGVVGVLLAYRGVDAAIFDALRVGTAHGSVSVLALPSVTTVTAGAWYIAAYWHAVVAASGQFTPPGTLTERLDLGTNSGAAGQTAYGGADDGAFAGAGATGPQIITALSRAIACSIVTALRPAPAPIVRTVPVAAALTLLGRTVPTVAALSAEGVPRAVPVVAVLLAQGQVVPVVAVLSGTTRVIPLVVALSATTRTVPVAAALATQGRSVPVAAALKATGLVRSAPVVASLTRLSGGGIVRQDGLSGTVIASVPVPRGGA